MVYKRTTEKALMLALLRTPLFLAFSANAGATSSAVLAELPPQLTTSLSTTIAVAAQGGALLAIDIGFMGPNFSISTACATSNYCIHAAAEQIQQGKADVMLCGGAEAPPSPDLEGVRGGRRPLHSRTGSRCGRLQQPAAPRSPHGKASAAGCLGGDGRRRTLPGEAARQLQAPEEEAELEGRRCVLRRGGAHKARP